MLYRSPGYMLGFYNVNTVLGSGDLSNMPAGFEIGMGDMVPLMGGHAWNVANQPSASNPWVAPVWIMGPYDGSIVSFELHFIFLISRYMYWKGIYVHMISTLINSFLDVVHALLLLRRVNLR